MSWPSLTTIKQYLGITTTNDDAVLQLLADQAKTKIETFCGRRFVAQSMTRTYDEAYVDLYVRGDRLYLDDDVISITQITNGNGVIIDSADYVLEPVNMTPKAIIRLRGANAWIAWPDRDIEIVGLWGYSTIPPLDVQHAYLRLIGYWYRQRDAQVYDVTAFPETGQLIVPKGMPPDIVQDLTPYRRIWR